MTVFAASEAVELYRSQMAYSLPQYESNYDPSTDVYTPVYRDYTQYVDRPRSLYPNALDQPLLEDTLSMAYAWAHPYWESKEEEEK